MDFSNSARVAMVSELYRSGLRDFNYVLDTQRTLFTQQCTGDFNFGSLIQKPSVAVG